MKRSAHLLVDGPNVLHAWPGFQGAWREGIEAARRRLVDRLAAIADEEGARVTVVFDGRGPEMVVEQSGGVAGVSVIRTPAGVTADDVIERLVGQASDPTACVVATADRGIIETIVAAGARALLPSDLLAWVERAEARQSARTQSHNQRNAKQWKRPL